MDFPSQDKNWITLFNNLLQRWGKHFRFEMLKKAEENQGICEVGLYVDDELISQGSASTLHQARQNAARRGMHWVNHYRGIDSEIQKLAHIRGMRNEELSLDLFAHPPFPLPAWFVAIRKATPEEDQRGIDAVVTTTDLGNLLLQIKSSRAGVRKFLERGRRSSLIGLYVLNPEHDEVRRLRGVLKVLDDLRSEILQLRGQHEDDF